MRLRPLATTTALAALVLLSACDRGGSRAPTQVGASAPPPPPSSAAAAAAPVAGTASPIPVPTPAGTTLALARSRAAARAAGGSSPCAGLRGSTLDACIDAAARTSASPVAIDKDADREFRAAQARRDQELMDREEEDARLAGQGSVGQPPDEEPSYDPRNDSRDYDPGYNDPGYNAEGDDPAYDPTYNDSIDEPPPDDEPPIDEPPPDPGYYPRR